MDGTYAVVTVEWCLFTEEQARTGEDLNDEWVAIPDPMESYVADMAALYDAVKGPANQFSYPEDEAKAAAYLAETFGVKPATARSAIEKAASQGAYKGRGYVVSIYKEAES